MKSFLRLMLAGLILTVTTERAMAGDDLEEKIKAMAETNAKSYMRPLVSGFGVAMNSGIFRSPETHSVLGFDFQLVIASAFAPKSEETYTPVLPPGYTSGKASTAIGPKSKTVFTGIGGDIELPGGAGVPGGASGFFVAPQLTVGVPFKTDVILRYVPAVSAGKVGKVGLFGLGAKHNLNQWIPLPIPLDLAAGVFYQKLSIGDVFKASAKSFDVLGGKSFNLLILKIGVYGGVGVESSSMDVKYEAASGVKDENGNDIGGQTVEFSQSGKNSMRGIVGANVRLMWLFNVNGELGFGKYKSATLGVGLTLR
ncbi:hypothetical protein L6Q79_01445 [bacterium]|nr:hypothetical protein [bacterium]NUN45574.1 hypothetical protein [bacterium]